MAVNTRTDLTRIGPHNLTPKQARVYEFIAGYFAENLRTPTYREIMAEFGIRSTNGVVGYLRSLKKKGVIKLNERTGQGCGVAHGIELVGLGLKLAVTNAVAEQVAKVLGKSPHGGKS